MIIASIVNNNNYLVLETDKNNSIILENNKKLNNFTFHIKTKALSEKKLIQKGWNTIQSDILLDDYFPVDIISLNDINEKYNINFDTLILDCEGAFYYILLDYPNILENINLIIIENDFININHEIFFREKMIENGFKLIYCKNVIASCRKHKKNFFEVYKKY